MAISLTSARHKTLDNMPEITALLQDLVALPSCAFPKHPAEPLNACADMLVERFGELGAHVTAIPLEDGPPCVFAEFAAQSTSAPTVLLYAHYDVQPASSPQSWTSDPWTLTERDGRLYGRGAADDKAGIAMIWGALRTLLGADAPFAAPDVHIKVLLEGEEEIGSPHLASFLATYQDQLQCDALLICDSGNVSTRQPALTVALRGIVSCRVEVKTLRQASHSGLFGGPTPDALMAITRMLSSLLNEAGEVAIPGLATFEWPEQTEDIDVARFRVDAGLSPGAMLLGSGPLYERLWCKPSVTVTGMDVPNLFSSNSLVPRAAAKVSLRIAPNAVPEHELEILTNFLRQQAPWGVECDVTPLESGAPFAADTSHPGIQLARTTLAEIYKTEPALVGAGGSIPIVATLQAISPTAAPILWGPQDLEHARIHAVDESVAISELADMTCALLLFLDRFAGLRDRTLALM